MGHHLGLAARGPRGYTFKLERGDLRTAARVCVVAELSSCSSVRARCVGEVHHCRDRNGIAGRDSSRELVEQGLLARFILFGEVGKTSFVLRDHRSDLSVKACVTHADSPLPRHFRKMYLNGPTSHALLAILMLIRQTSGLTRRAALGSLGALAFGAALSHGSQLAWAQQTDTQPQTLSELNQRRPGRSPVVRSGLMWKGYAADAANVRAEPNTESEITRELGAGEGVVVPIWVAGEEVDPDYPVWAELEPGQYAYLPLLRSFPVEEPPPISSLAPSEGRWIDVNLTLEIVTAYEGRTPVMTYLGSTGQPGWETPPGAYHHSPRAKRANGRS